ncbi:MAG: DUF3558 domain-containing protein [Actinophytocola sp.]|nr:DUF3558 domain-containing protein [Actinophytocola sp.]
MMMADCSGLVRICVAISSSLLALAGCSSETAGEPAGQVSSNSSPSSGSANGGDIPDLTVSNPLNVDPFIDRPCDLVPKRVADSFGGGTGQEAKGELADHLGPSCNWDLKGNGRAFHVSLGSETRRMGGRGLVEIYENVKAGIGGYVEPTEIPGHPQYPAAFGTLDDDKRSEGYCPVNIGTSNDMVVTVAFENLVKPSQACPAALRVAASVLDTLKKGD